MMEIKWESDRSQMRNMFSFQVEQKKKKDPIPRLHDGHLSLQDEPTAQDNHQTTRGSGCVCTGICTMHHLQESPDKKHSSSSMRHISGVKLSHPVLLRGAFTFLMLQPSAVFSSYWTFLRVVSGSHLKRLPGYHRERIKHR